MHYNDGFSGFAVPDVAAAREFYSEVLELQVAEDHGMLHLTLPGGTVVLAYPKEDHEPAVFTILNLVVPDLRAAVDELVTRGVAFERYEGFEQDERGIARGMGPDIAWTTDPGGNVIALMEGDGAA